MKILHLNSVFGIGGAGIAAKRLNHCMCKRGEDSRLLAGEIPLYAKDTYECICPEKNRSVAKLKMTFHQKLESLFLSPYHPKSSWSKALIGFNLTKIPEINEADVIYLHWLNGGFLSINGIAALLKLGKPVYWFMHDMWPITGGCHYAFDCIGYQSCCRNCPLLVSTTKYMDMSYRIFKQKLRLWQDFSNLKIITPSHWLANCVRQSKIFGQYQVAVIPNTLDQKIYQTYPKELARKLFGFPLDKKLLLFGADHGVDNPYKGWNYLETALAKIDLSDCELVLFGSDYDSLLDARLSCKCHFPGKLYDDYSLAMLYNAADVFITPSLADNFPNTIVESLSCGTPVVGFNIGGIPDLVRHQYTGYLAEYKNSDSLAEGIAWVLQNNLQSHAVEYAQKLCAPEIVFLQHQELWKQERLCE